MDEKSLKCPECTGKLFKRSEFGEGVWECEKCGVRWGILKTSIRKSRREE